ncbi:unnamed protein product [Dovyalis caffra]|uniref:Uncharacterized protein n=1 Tax=Dovyalis caffra TaxID=77055 RepID=A0AAV1RRV1_9ROSI|nr:unnamed protein product [Dovyalis caffra]
MSGHTSETNLARRTHAQISIIYWMERVKKIRRNRGNTNSMVSKGASTALVIAPAKAPLRNSPTSLLLMKS